MKTKTFLIFALFLVTQAQAQVKSSALDSLKKELSKFITTEMKGKAVGLSVALIDNQETVWSEGFGYADKENKIKATAQTVYRIGSISKLFTTTSILQLKEKNKLSLDSNIRNYIPDFSIKSRFEHTTPITARLLLMHHSGIPSDLIFKFMDKQPESYNKVVDYLKEEYLAQEPGQVFSYSNVGFSLLGVLVERLSKQSFDSYTHENLFKPMDMNNSTFYLTPEIEKLYAKGYNHGKVVNENPLRDVPAGQMHSNVLDLSNFIKMTFNQGMYNGVQVISAASLKEMQSKQNLNCPLDLDFSIGLCWWLDAPTWKYAGGSAEHGGDTFIYHGELLTLPTQKLGVVVLDNTSSGSATTRKVAEEILKKYLQLKTGLKDTQTAQKTQKKNRDEQYLKEKSGNYVLGPNLFVIKSVHHKLQAKQGPAMINFIPQDDNTFLPKAILLGFIPIKIKDQIFEFKSIEGKDYLVFKNHSRGSSIIGYKFDSYPIPDTWKNKCSKYLTSNDTAKGKTFDSFDLKIKDGFLLFSFKDISGATNSNVIRPVSATEAIVEGFGRGCGQTLFIKGDDLYYEGYVLKKKID